MSFLATLAYSGNRVCYRSDIDRHTEGFNSFLQHNPLLKQPAFSLYNVSRQLATIYKFSSLIFSKAFNSIIFKISLDLQIPNCAWFCFESGPILDP